jgi:hypothetical protein
MVSLRQSGEPGEGDPPVVDQLREGKMPFSAMLKFITRYGFMMGSGKPLPVGEIVPLIVVAAPLSGTGDAP